MNKNIEEKTQEINNLKELTKVLRKDIAMSEQRTQEYINMLDSTWRKVINKSNELCALKMEVRHDK